MRNKELLITDERFHFYKEESTDTKCSYLSRNRITFLLFLIICGFMIICTLFFFNNESTKGKIFNASGVEPESDLSIFKDQCNINSFKRFDCFPRGHPTEDLCNHRGCCWEQSKEKNVPNCFYSLSHSSYQYINITEQVNGLTAYIELVKASFYPNDVKLLRLDVNYITETQVNVKIFDPIKKRYEPPYPVLNVPNGHKSTNLLYKVNILREKSGFQVIRKTNNEIIFDTQEIGGFTFADQFLQISALLPSKYIYGLGHQRNEFLLNFDWNVITLFNHDLPPTDEKYIKTDKPNFYSSHPFYLSMENSSLSHGVLLLNSNAMDIVLQPAPAITFRPIGGIIDLYFFLGPSPTEVVQQYTALIGRPYMPPHWALGFHLSRLGYKSANETKEVLINNRMVGIPVDTQWNDLDYMDKRNDFTYDKGPYADLSEFVEYLHHNEMHYVMLIDPGISAGEKPGSYPPYDEGLPDQLFILDHTGQKPFQCRVWNLSNKTVFPDFTNPKTKEYWKNQIELQYRNQFKFDGIWLDMNEPTNFINGSFDGCANNSYENPPYRPRVDGDLLSFHTVCMSAIHHGGIHYDLHNIYGFMQTKATTKALETITEKRAFVITRATFPGIGHYSGSWTGDVSSTWDDMKYSVADTLSFNLFGIPLIGADICGFNYNTTVPLCQRWSQLGAFYPFSRNHNSDDNMVQDPYALGTDVILSAKKALQVRYNLLPYLYTLFWLANISGTTVARPVFFEFPEDKNTYSQYQQFFWGSALLIAPVLFEKETSVTVYFPKGIWYDYYTYKKINSEGSFKIVPAPLDTIPLFLRGGYIIPTQNPASTTAASRRNRMGLIVALDENNSASGTLFWDDGESLNTYEEKFYNLIEFNSFNTSLVSKVIWWNCHDQPPLGSVILINVNGVQNVYVNGQPIEDFIYDPITEALRVDNLAVSLQHPFTLIWST